MGVLGVGVDVCDIARFTATMQRTPRITERLFSERERAELQGRAPQSYAARFAVKEAVAKVLANTRGLHWHECEVLAGPHGEPHIQVHGNVQDAAQARGINRWHCSLSHDGGLVVAFVVAEGSDATDL